VGLSVFKDPKLLLIQYVTCIIVINVTEFGALFEIWGMEHN